MVRIILIVSTFFSTLIGFFLSGHDGLAMDITNKGKILYPISSGSEDAMILAFGLMSFIITFFYSVISILFDHRIKLLKRIYWINLIVFSFFVFLVSLDSSIGYAANLGDSMPLIGVTIAFVPALVLSILSFISYARKF